VSAGAPLDEALRALWRRCTYEVTLPSAAGIALRVGERAPLLDEALPPGVRTWAYLTACNPGGRRAADEENAAALARLDEDLAGAGYAVFPGAGGRDPEGTEDAWSPEPSRLVAGSSLLEAWGLARRHRQAAFLFGCRGAPVTLVVMRGEEVRAGRSIETVAWVQRDERGRVLMARPANKPLFFMPGGKRDPGEDDVTALARELDEELAVRVRTETLEALFVAEALAWGLEDTAVRMACYQAAIEGEPRPSGEIEELAWLGGEDALRMPPAGRLVVARV
jgi:8-oxo-dGTP diphosphatase